MNNPYENEIRALPIAPPEPQPPPSIISHHLRHRKETSTTKPLPRPPVPTSNPSPFQLNKALPQKPLPIPPAGNQGFNYRTFALIVVGFVGWFIAIVLLLPVIIEREAMPRTNCFLQSLIFGQREDAEHA
ncbi:hypothetical protein CC78DRAFT_529548 [Lojkania enalia]|uniref:Uncharacterized protein n=1 Tax=Lojkania enalia TaxID=147567 RepID=A0A9P4KGX0_9PLEO|nr:hypothetical protein CC78DRAFT_529548 [Didymosphaeria enalia]